MGRGGLSKQRWSRLLLAAVFVGLVATGCYGSGVYPVDFFYEMHYQPVHKFGEPDRLAANPEAVPITGKEMPVTLEAAKGISNPVPRTLRSCIVLTALCAMDRLVRGMAF
jgi:hypothetical protein